MLVPDPLFITGASALFALLFAGIVLAAGRNRPNVYLSLFLLAIAGNAFAEIMGALAGSNGDAVGWKRVATFFAAIDPLLIYAFAATFPRPNRLLRPAWLLPVAGGSLAVAVSAFWVLTPGAEHNQDLPALLARKAWTIFTAIVYLIIFREATLALWKRPGEPVRRALYTALAMASIPAFVRIFQEYNRISVALGLEPFDLPWALFWISMAFAPAVVLRFAGRLRGVDARELRWSINVAVVMGIFALAYAETGFRYLFAAIWGGVPADYQNPGLNTIATPIRWLVFGLFVSVAVLRHDMLGMSLKARRVSARLTIGAVALLMITATVMQLSAWIRRGEFLLGPLEGFLIGLLAFATQGARRLTDLAAHRFYNVPLPGDRAGQQRVYEEGLVRLADDPADLSHQAELARLQQELGLDAATARRLQQAVLDRLQVNMRLDVGVVFRDRYEVLRILARTAAGRVVLADDRILDRKVVLKEINLDQGARARAEVLEEARITAAIHHPNVVSAIDVVEEPNRILLVLEHVEGPTVADALATGSVGAAEATAIIEGALQGLGAAHAAGIVHRDVKPGNLLFGADGVVRLTDFGIAVEPGQSTARLGRSTGAAGTFGYMAPEQGTSAPATPAADVYAVGVLARELSALVDDGRWAPFIERCVQEDPRDRYHDASAALAAFRRLSKPTRGT